MISRLRVALTAVAGLLCTSSLSGQATPAPVFKACYVGDRTGTVYRVDDVAYPAPGAFPASRRNENGCATAKDQAFTWNQTGPQGPQGPVGAAGPIGPTGAAGAAGPIGATGAAGPAGTEGPIGGTGAAGPAGTAGPIGATGPAGPAGEAGPQGVKGDAGLTGPQGPSGQQGTQGVQGTPGTPGVSGYQFIQNIYVAVAAGTTINHAIYCPNAKLATGGGYRDEGGNLKVQWNSPLDGGAGWFWRISAPTTGSGAASLYVICVTAQ